MVKACIQKFLPNLLSKYFYTLRNLILILMVWLGEATPKNEAKKYFLRQQENLFLPYSYFLSDKIEIDDLCGNLYVWIVMFVFAKSF